MRHVVYSVKRYARTGLYDPSNWKHATGTQEAQVAWKNGRTTVLAPVTTHCHPNLLRPSLLLPNLLLPNLLLTNLLPKPPAPIPPSLKPPAPKPPSPKPCVPKPPAPKPPAPKLPAPNLGLNRVPNFPEYRAPSI